MNYHNIQIKSEQDILQICKILLPIIERYNVEKIDIIDTIPSYHLLKLDEELWNRFNPSEKYFLTEVENEELIINRGRINFHLKGDGDYNYPVKTDAFGGKYIEEQIIKKNK